MTGYVGNHNSYTVECPTCGALPNQPCWSIPMDHEMTYTHAARRQKWLDRNVHHYDAEGRWVRVKP